MQKLTVTFRKRANARFLSHLDLAAVFEYAVRRADLPVARSEGFNPRPKISVATSLALGYVGEAELVEIVLREPIDPQEAGERLSAALPAGIEIVEVEDLPQNTRSAAARVCGAVYRVDLPVPVLDLKARVDAILLQPTLIFEEERDGAVRRRDVRPMIVSLEFTGQSTLHLEVTMDGGGSVRPEHILAHMHLDPEGTRITRERLILVP